MLASIRTEGVSKVHGTMRILSEVTATFESHSVTVIEGPNGAGKTSLLRILALLSQPSRGKVWFGEQLASALPLSYRTAIGVLSHSAMLYPDLTGQENLAFFAKCYGVDPQQDALLTLLDIKPSWLMRPVRTYSKGQTQRLALARALIHAPDVLLLDEPSTGLDTASVDHVCQVIEHKRLEGGIIILVTHDAAFAERLATHQIRLEQGRVVPRQSQ